MEEIKTGDVLYRNSDALGPFYIPFSRLVTFLSKSVYSHASIVIKEDGYTNILEINENGVNKIPLEKWECLCVGNVYSIYRLKEPVDEARIIEEVNKMLEEKPEYDYTFDDPNKIYCTESVAKIYERAGYKDVFKPLRIREVVSYWLFCILKPVNSIVKMLTKKGMSREPLYFVGNENQGMMASDKMYKVKDVYLERKL